MRNPYTPLAPGPVEDSFLAGRVALVTGGGGGIGSVIGEFLAARGASVALLDIDESRTEAVAEEIEDAGGTAAAVVADLSDLGATEEAIARTRETLGPISILVNNATSAGEEGMSLIEKHPDPWVGSTMDVDLKGMFICVRATWADLVAHGSGRIVNVISSAAYRGAPYIGSYAAAKNGMIALSRVLAAEGAPYGITSNCVEPGFTATKRLMGEGVRPAFGDDFDHPNFDLNDRQKEKGVWAGMADAGPEDLFEMMGTLARDMGVMTTPMRPVYPEEVAGAVDYLVGPDAAIVTGTTINVNGGMVMP
jgi:2-hydroxycyclohexanecarboxyl-CoA dehydrogenase